MNHIPVNPDILLNRFPADARVTRLAANQPEYETMNVVQSPSVQHPGAVNVVSCWRPTLEERKRIFAGEDVYLTILTAKGSPQPVIVSCGALDWRQQ